MQKIIRLVAKWLKKVPIMTWFIIGVFAPWHFILKLPISSFDWYMFFSMGFVAPMFASVFMRLAQQREQRDRELQFERAKGNSGRYPSKLVPRLIAHALHRFLPEYILGDLEEVYQDMVSREGDIAANHWYNRQMLVSLWPQLCRAVKRMVSRIAR